MPFGESMSPTHIFYCSLLLLHLGHIRYEYLNESENKETKKKEKKTKILLSVNRTRAPLIKMIDSIQTRQKKQSTKCMVDNEAFNKRNDREKRIQFNEQISTNKNSRFKSYRIIAIKCKDNFSFFLFLKERGPKAKSVE